MEASFAELMGWALVGVAGAAVVACVPALHIYNVAGYLLLWGGVSSRLSPEHLAFLFAGMVTGYAMLNTLSSIFLSVPDESTVFMVLPGQAYLMQRRGYEAVVLSGLGGLGGLVVLVLLVPLAGRVLPAMREILRPHLGWLLWTVIAYMLLSEWPKGSDRAAAGWPRLWHGWVSLLAGLSTFLLSGLLGFVLMYRPLVPVTVGYQNLMPAFVGLFAVPWIVQNLLARVTLPPQMVAKSIDAPLDTLVRGVGAGALGGMFAAFFPVVTGGMGGLLAGHATAQRDTRAFLVAQGTAKVVYYVGGFLFFFVPGLYMTRGGMAWMLSTCYRSYTPETCYAVLAAVLLTGVVAFFLLLGLSRWMITLTARLSYPYVNWIALLLLLLVVTGMTGVTGLAICAVATGIGLIPVLWGSRRMHAMGLLLLPIGLNMAGGADAVAGFLGLL